MQISLVRIVGHSTCDLFVCSKMKYFLLFLLVSYYSPAESLSLKNVGKSAIDVVKGVAEKIPDVIPSGEDLFQYGKNILAGYPFEKVSLRRIYLLWQSLICVIFIDRFFRSSTRFVSHELHWIFEKWIFPYNEFSNFLGSAALSTDNVKPRKTPNIANMSYVLKIRNQNISVPLNQPKKLWALREFNPRLPLVMVITGWTTNANDTENPALDVIWPAYKCRGNVNFVVSFQYLWV